MRLLATALLLKHFATATISIGSADKRIANRLKLEQELYSCMLNC